MEADSRGEMNVQELYERMVLGSTPKTQWREEKEAELGIGRTWAVMLSWQGLSSDAGIAPPELFLFGERGWALCPHIKQSFIGFGLTGEEGISWSG